MHFETYEDDDELWFYSPPEYTSRLMDFLRNHIRSITIDLAGQTGGQLEGRESETELEIDTFNFEKHDPTENAVTKEMLDELLARFWTSFN